MTVPVPAPEPDLATSLVAAGQAAGMPPRPARRGIDVGVVITRALTAAGLMK